MTGYTPAGQATTAVNVTAHHILAGRRDSVQESPVALALRDTFRASAAQAGETSFAVILEGRSPGVLMGALPPAAAAFTVHHNNGRHVKPFMFTVSHADLPIFYGPACWHPVRRVGGSYGPCERPARHGGYHRRFHAHGHTSYTLGCRCQTCSDAWIASGGCPE